MISLTLLNETLFNENFRLFSKIESVEKYYCRPKYTHLMKIKIYIQGTSIQFGGMIL